MSLALDAEGAATAGQAGNAAHAAEHAAPSLAPLILHAHDLLHHLLGLLERGEELVDVLRRRPTAGGDATLAAAGDHVGVAPLLERHREDDRLGHLHLVAFE